MSLDPDARRGFDSELSHPENERHHFPENQKGLQDGYSFSCGGKCNLEYPEYSRIAPDAGISSSATAISEMPGRLQTQPRDFSLTILKIFFIRMIFLKKGLTAL